MPLQHRGDELRPYGIRLPHRVHQSKCLLGRPALLDHAVQPQESSHTFVGGAVDEHLALPAGVRRQLGLRGLTGCQQRAVNLAEVVDVRERRGGVRGLLRQPSRELLQQLNLARMIQTTDGRRLDRESTTTAARLVSVPRVADPLTTRPESQQCSRESGRPRQNCCLA